MRENKCKHCGSIFTPTKNQRQIYCNSCRQLEVKKCQCGCNEVFKDMKFKNRKFINNHNSKLYKCSEDTKKLISNSKIGILRNQETKGLISKTLSGRTWEDLQGIDKAYERKQKHIKRLTGKHHSKETKKLMGLSKLGDNNPSKRPEVIEKIKITKQNLPEEIKEKTRSLMRDGVKRRMARGEKIGIQNPYFVSELGHKVRSSYEEKVGLFLKRNNICYAYEKPFLITHPNNSKHNYYMDFILLDYNIAVEVKGYCDDHSSLKINLFKEQYPEYKLIVIGIRDMLVKKLENLRNNILDLNDLEDLLILTK